MLELVIHDGERNFLVYHVSVLIKHRRLKNVETEKVGVGCVGGAAEISCEMRGWLELVGGLQKQGRRIEGRGLA